VATKFSYSLPRYTELFIIIPTSLRDLIYYYQILFRGLKPTAKSLCSFRIFFISVNSWKSMSPLKIQFVISIFSSSTGWPRTWFLSEIHFRYCLLSMSYMKSGPAFYNWQPVEQLWEENSTVIPGLTRNPNYRKTYSSILSAIIEKNKVTKQ